MSCRRLRVPDRPFHNFRALIDEFYAVQNLQSTEFEAVELRMFRSGSELVTKRKGSRIQNLVSSKETTLERANFTLQLLMFVTSEKERELFIIFFLFSFRQLLSPRF